jgi:hypothetical protein
MDNHKHTEKDTADFLRDFVLTSEDEGRADGWYNRFFEFEPTARECDDWVIKNWTIKNRSADRKRQQRINRLIKDEDPDLISSRIITLSFDSDNHKELEKPPAYTKGFCQIYVDEFKKSNYKWMNNGKMSFEFYTNNGFKPHIHIYTESNEPIGQIALGLRRKFVEKTKWKIYRVNVKPGTPANQEEYLPSGGLCDSSYDSKPANKQMEKMQYVEKDIELRKKNNIQHSYEI